MGNPFATSQQYRYLFLLGALLLVHLLWAVVYNFQTVGIDAAAQKLLLVKFLEMGVLGAVVCWVHYLAVYKAGLKSDGSNYSVNKFGELLINAGYLLYSLAFFVVTVRQGNHTEAEVVYALKLILPRYLLYTTIQVVSFQMLTGLHVVSRKTLGWLLVLALFAAFFNNVFLFPANYYIDELTLFNPVYNFVNEGKLYYPVHGFFLSTSVHPPLHYLLIGLAFKCGLGLRFSQSADIFLFLVAFVWVGRKLEKYASVYVVLLCALVWFFCVFPISLRPEQAINTGFIMCAVFLMYALQTNRLLWYFITGFSMAFVSTMHYYAVFFILAIFPVGVLLLYRNGFRWSEAKAAVVALVLPVIIVYGFYFVVYYLPARSEISNALNAHQGMKQSIAFNFAKQLSIYNYAKDQTGFSLVLIKLLAVLHIPMLVPLVACLAFNRLRPLAALFIPVSFVLTFFTSHKNEQYLYYEVILSIAFTALLFWGICKSTGILSKHAILTTLAFVCITYPVITIHHIEPSADAMLLSRSCSKKIINGKMLASRMGGWFCGGGYHWWDYSNPKLANTILASSNRSQFAFLEYATIPKYWSFSSTSEYLKDKNSLRPVGFFSCSTPEIMPYVIYFPDSSSSFVQGYNMLSGQKADRYFPSRTGALFYTTFVVPKRDLTELAKQKFEVYMPFYLRGKTEGGYDEDSESLSEYSMIALVDTADKILPYINARQYVIIDTIRLSKECLDARTLMKGTTYYEHIDINKMALLDSVLNCKQ
jgi:hypothetical protein